uniref:Putative reverse transcriptase domain-containing protein n=1 Tax=Tanacetum cinerariifolium TaxID=118510 RepID=A0A6L2MQE4_TANCI|nr:putative reverse transcriptase domain-containing protein [Tanacetum cinerariifolium]
MEFQVGDRVMVKVSPWKRVVRFGKQEKLNRRYVGPLKELAKVEAVAYKLELPQELNKVHNTFHVSNLKKSNSDEPLAVPLDGLHIDDKLYFLEEPIKIIDREVKQLKQSCSSCGALYTTDYYCSDGSLEDKIICDLDKTPDLSQRPPQNYPKCGNPVDGHYCQGCALLRKKFKDDLFTYCIENGIFQDSSEPSNDNTNVVNALQEPFIVKQDPGKNSLQSPRQINHHCCFECGDSFEDIFCHQCTCELCGRGAHYGYDCPPKVPIVPDPEPFNNQTVDELLQIVPSFDSTCYSKDGN